jgi:hypothetical protein
MIAGCIQNEEHAAVKGQWGEIKLQAVEDPIQPATYSSGCNLLSEIILIYYKTKLVKKCPLSRSSLPFLIGFRQIQYGYWSGSYA